MNYVLNKHKLVERLKNLSETNKKFENLVIILENNNNVKVKIYIINNKYNIYIICNYNKNLKFKIPKGFIIIENNDTLEYRGYITKISKTSINYDRIYITPKIKGMIGLTIYSNDMGWIHCNITSYNKEKTLIMKEIFDNYLNSLSYEVRSNLEYECMNRKLTLCIEYFHPKLLNNSYIDNVNYFYVSVISTEINYIKENQILSYLTIMEKDYFCKKYNLPYLPTFVIDNKYNIEKYFNEFNLKYDNIYYNEWIDIIKKYSSYSDMGNFNYNKIIGNILECTKIYGEYKNGMDIINIKLPIYNCYNKIYLKYFKICVKNYLKYSKCINPNSLKYILEDIKLITKTESGYNYWSNIIISIFNNLEIYLNKIDLSDTSLSDMNMNIKKYTNNLINIKIHSSIWKYTLNEYKYRYNNNNKDIHIGIIIGPIGAGKSTIMKNISSYINNNKIYRAEEIDGDILDIGKEKVLKCGKERQPYTEWKIINTIINGNIPIISCGGGVLMYNDKLRIKTKIEDCFNGYTCRLHVFIPYNDINNTNMIRKCNNYNINNLYNIYKLDISKIINKRINNGEWTMYNKIYNRIKYINNIQKKSEYNYKFAKILIDNADEIYEYPLLKYNNYNINYNFDNIFNIKYINYPTKFKYTKIQLLILPINEESKIQYITLENNYKKNGYGDVNTYKKYINIKLPYIIQTKYVETKGYHINNEKYKEKYDTVKIYLLTDELKDIKFPYIIDNNGPYYIKECNKIVPALNKCINNINLKTRRSQILKHTLKNINDYPDKLVEIINIYYT